MAGQRPKSRAKAGHGRAPCQKQGISAAMAAAAVLDEDVFKFTGFRFACAEKAALNLDAKSLEEALVHTSSLLEC